MWVLGTATDAHAGSTVRLCHATGQPDSWVSVSVSANAVISAGHTTHQDGRDIIPPFDYQSGGYAKRYPGLNWTSAGQAIWSNDCVNPEPTPTITFAARVCDAYADVFANRNRNNLMQSLEDLGPDSPYRPGDQVLPTAEDRAPQNDCRPLIGWRFTLGTSVAGRDVGAWGSLSRVGSAYSTAIITRQSTTLPNVMGGTTGSTIAGAITIPLTDAQAERATAPARLWVQGGTPGDPVLTTAFGARYSFAALRCSTDNLNGDNVEWIAFPTGQTNVYCYAYYVEKPPASGTIAIVKNVASPNGGDVRQTALFDGSANFDEMPIAIEASSASPGRIELVRAATGPGDAPWTLTEIAQPGWRLESLACDANGGSTWVATGATATITLAAGDRVVCTYVDVVDPPATQGITLQALTIGAPARMSASVVEVANETTQGSAALRTTNSGIPSPTATVPLTRAGRFRVEVGIPVSTAGTWTLGGVLCDGIPVAHAEESFTVDVPPGSGVTCLVEADFKAAGSITIRKATIGGTGTVGFAVWRAAESEEDGRVYMLRAMTARSGLAASELALPIGDGDRPQNLPLDTYVLQELDDSFDSAGEWAIQSVICDGTAQMAIAGRVVVHLTAANPRTDCTFANRLLPHSTAGTPSGPGMPTRGPASAPRMEHRAALQVDLQATPGMVRDSGTISYRAVIGNAGPDTARNVFLTLTGPGAVRPWGATASSGTCRMQPVVTCALGDLAPGARVMIRAERPVVVALPRGRAARPGRYLVRAALTTSTSQRSAARSMDSAWVTLATAPEAVTG